MPFGLQPIHLLVIVIVALVIFGPKRLPQIGRWIGRTFSEFRKGAREMADGIKDGAAQAAPGQPQKPGTAEEAPSPTPPVVTFCTRCGASNPADARFCNMCGLKLPS